MNNEEYLNEKTKFYFVEKGKNMESAKVYTDNENYLVCQSAPGVQVWLWTKDYLSVNKLKELKEVLLCNYVTNDKVTFTSKKDVYEYLLNTKDKYELDEYFEMGTLKCMNVVKPREVDTYLDHFHADDYETAAKYYYLDQLEMGLNSDVTMEDAYEHVKSWVENDNYLLLRNNNGKVVSMVSYNTFDDMAKLGNVYTPKEERRKGYCAFLVYTLSKKLLESGFTPMLYTDYNYVNSNNAYKKVGYQDTGLLVTYTLKK